MLDLLSVIAFAIGTVPILAVVFGILWPLKRGVDRMLDKFEKEEKLR
jgi:hypothetical protein